jgi:hypothetical protein
MKKMILKRVFTSFFPSEAFSGSGQLNSDLKAQKLESTRSMNPSSAAAAAAAAVAAQINAAIAAQQRMMAPPKLERTYYEEGAGFSPQSERSCLLNVTAIQMWTSIIQRTSIS